MNEVISAADDYVRVSLIKMIVSPTEDFYKSWGNMVSHLKEMGVEEVGEQVTELIQDKQKLWEKE